MMIVSFYFFFSSRRRHTRCLSDWSSDVCSSDLTLLADRLIAFDPDTGRLRAQAGVSLAQLNRLFLPRGWFTPVSTGTAYVTLGGMVASDVHGKNHHVAGTFGEHVSALRMRVADGRVLEVTEAAEPAL